MAQHAPQSKLDLIRASATEEREELIVLLEEALAIIEAADDPDCESWLEQTRSALAKCRSKP
jgi:hypothetical protein